MHKDPNARMSIPALAYEHLTVAPLAAIVTGLSQGPIPVRELVISANQILRKRFVFTRIIAITHALVPLVARLFVEPVTSHLARGCGKITVNAATIGNMKRLAANYIFVTLISRNISRTTLS